MEYYLVVTEALTGVIVTIHGFTFDEADADERVLQFDEEHGACDGFIAADHECPEHDQRIVIHSIYKLEV